MNKVIIADDEMIIREGLKSSINWKELDLSLIGCAKNGNELLEMVNKEMPDICLVDICMPKLNGLKLIAKIKEIDKDIICIIVSGYDEFDYAQKAIKLNVFDYILKPVNEKRLNKCLEKAVEFIREQDKARIQMEKSSEILEKNMDLLQERFLVNLVQGQYSTSEINNLMEFYGVVLGENFLTTIISISKDEDICSGERELLGYKLALKDFVKNELEKKFDFSYVAIDDYENMFVLINVEKNYDWNQHLEDLERKLNLLVKAKIYSELTNGSKEDIYCVYEKLLKEINKVYSDIVKGAKNKIDNEYSNAELCFSVVAKELGVSISYLSKQFKKELGFTYVEYLTRLRIKRAIELLEKTDLRIVEISEKVGYTSQHYFSAVFKKITGVNPNNYMESKNKNRR